MYRKASSTSVLSGVPSGTYTGGQRVIDGALLERATRERLDRSLSMRGSPAPIAYERPASHASSRPVWGIIGATMGLSTAFAIGFGNLDSDWALPPWWSLVVYLGLAYLFASSLLPLLRRRALFGGGARGALRPGRYLFPLDAVEIALPDASGQQLVTVRPLGDARHADVELDGKRVDLVLGFEGGEVMRFTLRGDHKGTVALRRLEHAQKLLEDLTYKHRLEDAFANDLFFDLRVDNAWARFAPGAAASPARAPNVLSLALGRFAPALLAVVTLGLGAGTFVVRREAGDTALYNHAVAYGSVDAIDRYLARGGQRRLAAQDLKTRLLESEKARRQHDLEQTRSGGQSFDTVEEAAVDQRCIDSLEAHASEVHPRLVPALVRAIRSRERTLYLMLDFRNPPASERGDASFHLSAEMQNDQTIVESAFTKVFSDICPSSVLSLVRPTWGTRQSPRLWVTATPHWLPATWRLTDLDGKPFEARQLSVEFHAAFIEGEETLETFDLTVPPPHDPPVGLRPKSLFVVELDPNGHDQRVYSAMVARAYDRLYDEIWSLFFTGDPRVPLVRAPVLTP